MSSTVRSLNILKLTGIWAMFGCISLIAVRILIPVESTPQAWKPPTTLGYTGVWEKNNQLATLTTDHRHIPNRKTVTTDVMGRRYASLRNGDIIRWSSTDGEIGYLTQLLGSPTGMAFDILDNLYVLEENHGALWKVSPQKKVSQIPLRTRGKPIQYLNDITLSLDGRAFITQSSSRWSSRYISRALLEHHNDGAIYVWPGSGEPQLLAKGLAFPSGIVMAHDRQSVIVAETSEYRISRVWLSGARKGQRETIIDNLPGFPSDIAIAKDGKHYWGVFFDYRHNIPLLDKLASRPWLRRLMINFPLTWFPQNKGTPAVFLFDEKGVKKTYQLQGKSDIPGFSSVIQRGNELILSSASPQKHIDTRVFRFNIKDALETASSPRREQSAR